MLDSFLAAFFLFSASVLMLAFAAIKIKTLFVSGTISINREIDSGEHVVYSTNFYVGESDETILDRQSRLAEIGIMRKDFVFQRFNNVLAEAEEENRVTKLKG